MHKIGCLVDPFVEPANLNPAALPMATKTNMAVMIDDFE